MPTMAFHTHFGWNTDLITPPNPTGRPGYAAWQTGVIAFGFAGLLMLTHDPALMDALRFVFRGEG